jgi:hypothetical protein
MRYSNDSKLINYIRERWFKIDKPVALVLGGWEAWYNELRRTRPVAYFITEGLPRVYDRVITRLQQPWTTFRKRMGNRFIYGTHVLHTGLEVGQWHETDVRLMYGMMTAVQDFVEIECAWHHCAIDPVKRKIHNMPRWRLRIPFVSSRDKLRNAACGLEYLALTTGFDRMGADNDPQEATDFDSAREVMIIYTWWTQVWPNRPDSTTAAGLDQFIEEVNAKYNDENSRSLVYSRFMHRFSMYTTEEQNRYRELSLISNQIREQYEAEDTEMLMRVVKIRHWLWT